MTETCFAPHTVGEASAWIREQVSIRVTGTGAHAAWTQSVDGTTLSTSNLSGIVELAAADQVAVVRSGTPLAELRAELAALGLALPCGCNPALEREGTLGGALAMHMPTYGEVSRGAWRDHILGMTVVLGDGLVARSGSRAVKSVAGYDAHKLFLGSRGSFGLIAEVIIRLVALEPVEPPNRLPGCRSVQRVRRTDLDALVAASSGDILVDAESATVWSREAPARRFEEDWALEAGAPVRMPAAQLDFVHRARKALDPSGRWASEAFELEVPR